MVDLQADVQRLTWGSAWIDLELDHVSTTFVKGRSKVMGHFKRVNAAT